MSSTRSTAAFEKAFAALNPEQREAATHLEGPLMVLAGPGTGKTTLLATRVGCILLNQPDVRPEEILCITYSNAGSLAMSRKLADMLGPEGRRVQVFTFHGLGNQLLTENPELAGLRDQAEAAHELDRRRAVRRLLDHLNQNEPQHPLARLRGDAYHDANNLLELFAWMNRNAVSPQLLQQRVEEYLAELPTMDGFGRKHPKPGDDPLTKSGQQEHDRLQRTRAAAGLYDRYRELLHESRRFEYDDMILRSIEALRDHDDLRFAYAERYQFVLVDEYQDTSGSQNQLLYHLLDHPLPEQRQNPNVMVVGDDDQSIYGFQGAFAHNMQDFLQRYPTTRVIGLRQNYRSSASILAVAQACMAPAPDRLRTNPQLLERFGNLNTQLEAQPAPSPPLPVRLRVFANPHAEQAQVLAELEAQHRNGTPLNQLAVLYRNNKHGEALFNALRSKGIAVQMSRRTNLWDSPLVQQWLEWLTLLDGLATDPGSEATDHLLGRALQACWWGWSATSSHHLALRRSLANTPDGKRPSWLECLQQAATDPTQPDAGHFEHLARQLPAWARLLGQQPLPLAFDVLAQQCGVLDYLLRSPQPTADLEVWLSLRGFVHSQAPALAQQNNQSLSLKALLELVQEMKDLDVRQEVDEVVGPPDGVQLKTLHAAKGLEFDWVWMLNCGEKDWATRGHTGFKLPPVAQALAKTTPPDAQSENRRLFFVGLSRARHQLTLSYSAVAGNQKAQGPVDWWDDLLAANLPPEVLSVPDGDSTESGPPELVDWVVRSLMPAFPDHLNAEHPLLRQRLQALRLSPNSWNTWLESPVDFYLYHVLGLPQAVSPACCRGIALHTALKNFIQQGGGSPEQLPEAFRESYSKFRGQLSPVEFDRSLAWARQVLPPYARQMQPVWSRCLSQEVNLEVELDGVPLKGRYDRLERGPNGLVLVDVKTTILEKARKGLALPRLDYPQGLGQNGNSSELGGSYWRQLMLYVLMLQATGTPEPVVAVAVEVPDANDRGEHRVEVPVEPEMLEWVRSGVGQSWAAIQRGDFFETALQASLLHLLQPDENA